jgi:quercetin dioxygenase-like cupin family protein
MILRVTDKYLVAPQPGVLRAVVGHQDRLMLVEVAIEAGVEMPLHEHPHEQITYVIRGSVQFRNQGGERFVLAAGESCTFAPNEWHGVEALSDALVLDAFSPPRAEFL